jgi:hypothetical protein
MTMKHKEARRLTSGARWFWGTLTLICAGLANAEDGARQPMDDAWWTGPLLAASASTLPSGHVLVEPYLYDVITYGRYDTGRRRISVPHENDFGSQSYLLYGLVDRVSVGLIPRFGFKDENRELSSSGIGVGDLSFQAQYRLTQFQEGQWVPTTSLVLAETFPTGRYDRLDRHPLDGFGTGAHTTTVSFYSQDYFWLSIGRILRTRLDLSYAFSDRVALDGVSVYETRAGFVGSAKPGDSFSADSSWEYSVTHNWVLALDVVYERDATTSLVGSYLNHHNATQSFEVQESSGVGSSLGFAPALEYNWSARMGVIAGVRVIPIGHNSSATVTPVVAVNMVF